MFTSIKGMGHGWHAALTVSSIFLVYFFGGVSELISELYTNGGIEILESRCQSVETSFSSTPGLTGQDGFVKFGFLRIIVLTALITSAVRRRPKCALSLISESSLYLF